MEIKQSEFKTMNCPNCKNSNQTNSKVCEWCGSKLVEDGQISSLGYKFEKEILDLVLAGRRKKAVKLFSKYTVKDLIKSEQEVNRLIVASGLSIIEIEKIEKEHLLLIIYSVIGLITLVVFLVVFYVQIHDGIFDGSVSFDEKLSSLGLFVAGFFSLRKSYQLFIKLKINHL